MRFVLHCVLITCRHMYVRTYTVVGMGVRDHYSRLSVCDELVTFWYLSLS